MNRKSITVFLESLNGGGAEQSLVTLMNAFVDDGYKIKLILCKPNGVLENQLYQNIEITNLYKENLYLALPSLIKILRNDKPEVVLTTLDLANVILLIARLIASVNTKVVIRIANTISIQKRCWLKKRLEHLLLSWIYPLADSIVCVSQDVADDLASYLNLPQERITCIYNPVITPKMMELANLPLSHSWFNSKSLPVILGVGRLVQQKNFERLITAFSLIQATCPSRLIILGEGEQRKKLESLVQKLGLNNQILLPGFVENPFNYMKNANLFVLSSDWEGLPGVLIQALALGCPVVSTDCPSGPKEILDNGKYGQLVAVNDVNALANAMSKALLESNDYPNGLWLKQFSLTRVVEQYLAVLFSNEVIGKTHN